MLARTERGEGPAVALVHGFTQNAQSWEGLIERCSRSRRYVSVDLPGHGGSSKVSASFAETAELVGKAGGEAGYIGYSLGGRVCLQLAVSNPAVVSSLVLISASPGLVDPDERRQRRERDERLARFIEEAGVEAFLERWLAQSMFAGLGPMVGEHIAERKGNDASGLARSLRDLGTGAMEPLWDGLTELRMPVLIIAGGHDQKFCDIGRSMLELIPNATYREVPRAGHAAHLEAPDAVARLIEEFLAGHAPPS